MIIDCIGCLHGYLPQLEGDGDLLIVTGDLTARDSSSGYIKFYEWLEKQTYRKKIVIPGNHDGYFEKCNTFSPSPFGDDLATYLCNSGTEFEDLKIWGTPHSLWFDQINPKASAFTKHEYELKEIYDQIPDDIDILISHTPFWGILDQNIHGYLCGSRSLRDTIDRVKPQIFICSHIHEQGGNEIMYKHQGPNTWCVNCSIMNEDYEPINEPIRLVL